MKIQTANKINLACGVTVLAFNLAKKKIPVPIKAGMIILEGLVMINAVANIYDEVKKLM